METTDQGSAPPALHPKYVEGEKLGAEISELCSYIYAATYRLLVLIREFDEKGYWQLPGFCSCAHWLNFQCGIGMNAAREKVRVAHALAGLPKISAAFARGELSWSKVRAMTRIADASNEDYLLMVAHHGTAFHIEKLVSLYRRCKRSEEVALANLQYEHREVNLRYEPDGSVVLQARLPAEQGAMLQKALALAVERREADRHEARDDVSAETRVREPIRIAQADALAEMAEAYLASEPASVSAADRYQVVVHVSAETLRSDDAVEVPARHSADGDCGHDRDRSHLEDGARVSAETARRLACDCSRIPLFEDEEGEPLAIGRKSRSIPPAIRRVLKARDDGCRFPGCTRTRFVDAHHIEHWADGGETSLDNLVSSAGITTGSCMRGDLLASAGRAAGWCSGIGATRRYRHPSDSSPSIRIAASPTGCWARFPTWQSTSARVCRSGTQAKPSTGTSRSASSSTVRTAQRRVIGRWRPAHERPSDRLLERRLSQHQIPSRSTLCPCTPLLPQSFHRGF